MNAPNRLNDVTENRLLGRWAGLLGRHPGQLNGVHESDAELVPLPGGQGLLALTVDTIAEEIALGFYREPETMGWMGATACLSDLAAVGATPLGLVVSVSLPRHGAEAFQEGVARGIEAACRASGTFVLGGDTNIADAPTITGCAAGLVAPERVMCRKGAAPGQLVCTTGRLGAGAAAAARAVLGLPESLYAERDYRPRPRTAAGQAIAGFATAAMDTSDGLIATLDQLTRLNSVGFDIEAPLFELLEPKAQRLCRTLSVPPLAMLGCHHGEFELVFTVPPPAFDALAEAALAAGVEVIVAGRTIPEPEVRIAGCRVDSARLRNLADDAGSDPRRYLGELLRLVHCGRLSPSSFSMPSGVAPCSSGLGPTRTPPSTSKSSSA